MNDTKHNLSICINHFEANREIFVESHHKMFVVICNSEVVGLFDDVGTAYKEAKAVCGEKTFLVRQCLTLDEEKANSPVFHSRVA